MQDLLRAFSRKETTHDVSDESISFKRSDQKIFAEKELSTYKIEGL